MSTEASVDLVDESRNEPPYRSQRDLAERYQVSERQVRKWQEQGLITPVRLGGIVRFDAKAVEELDEHFRNGGANK